MGDRLDAAIHAGPAAPFSLTSLHLELKKRLTVVASKFSQLETKEGTAKAPDVLDGFVPPKPGGDAAQFPFILVRPNTGEDSWEGADQNASATMKIVIGTYSDDDAGWLDVMMIIDAIRSDLGESPAIDGTAFEHFGPLRWEFPEAQARPQWFGIVTTIWNISRPRRIEARNPDPEEG